MGAMKRLIVITGGRTEGKSSFAKVLMNDYGYVNVKFADGLKNMLRTFGLSEAEIEGNLKQHPSKKLCGQTPVHAMQTLGTEWGREMIGKDVWVNKWMETVRTQLRFSLSTKICCDDLRYLNEAQAVRDCGGMIIRIQRGKNKKKDLHTSETEMMNIKHDLLFNNNKTLTDLSESIHSCFKLVSSEN